jgi:imidazolonepropionase-like amidohydrolase
MERLFDAGLSPADVIVAATRTGAAFLGPADFGELAPGRLADLVLVDGRPDARIGDVRRVSRVMAGGQWVQRRRYLGY